MVCFSLSKNQPQQLRIRRGRVTGKVGVQAMQATAMADEVAATADLVRAPICITGWFCEWLPKLTVTLIDKFPFLLRQQDSLPPTKRVRRTGLLVSVCYL